MNNIQNNNPPIQNNVHDALTCAIPYGSSMIYCYGTPDNRISFHNIITGTVEIFCDFPDLRTTGPLKDSIPIMHLHHGTNLLVSNFAGSCVVAIDLLKRTRQFTIGKYLNPGFKDGENGLLARPGGISSFRNKDLLICDFGNKALRRFVWSTRKLETICGQPDAEKGIFTRDGPPMKARLHGPFFAVIEPVHEEYAYFTNIHSIRSVHLKTGIVSTIAGGVLGGHVDETFLKSRFSMPTALFIDYNGKLIVCDSGNKTLRLMDLVTQKVMTLHMNQLSVQKPMAIAINEISGELCTTFDQGRFHRIELQSIPGKLVVPSHLVWKRFQKLVRFLAITRPLKKIETFQTLFQTILKRETERYPLRFKVVLSTCISNLAAPAYNIAKSDLQDRITRHHLNRVRTLIARVLAQNIGVSKIQFPILVEVVKFFTKDTTKKTSNNIFNLNLLPMTSEDNNNDEIMNTNPRPQVLKGMAARRKLRDIFYSTLSKQEPYKPNSLNFLAEDPKIETPMHTT